MLCYRRLTCRRMSEPISTGELSHINFEKVGPPVLGWSTAFRILPVILELRTLMPCRKLNVYVALFVMLYLINHFKLLQRL